MFSRGDARSWQMVVPPDESHVLSLQQGAIPTLSCSTSKALTQLHAHLITTGLHQDPLASTKLIESYSKMGPLESAKLVFNTFPKPDSFMWGVLIKCCVWNRFFKEAISLYDNMLYKLTHISSFIFPSVLRACCGFGDLGIGQKVHGRIIKSEACGELGLLRQAKSVHCFVVSRDIQSNGSLDNSLVAMYGKCGDLYSAERLFDNVVNRCTSSWTAMITCYNNNGCYREALDIFVEMHEPNAEPNAVTMMGVLCSCARLGRLKEGKSVHGSIIRRVMDPENDLLRPALIDMYSNCGNLRDCHKIFDTTRERHVVSWNMLISGYAREGMSEEALLLFVQMQRQLLLPDSFTLASALSACRNIGFFHFGCQIHGYVIKTGSSSEFVQNSLIDMYSKCGFVESSYKIFENNQQKSVIMRNSMMCGFSQNGSSAKALNLFDQMYSDRLEMDEVTFLSAIQACSNLGMDDTGYYTLLSNIFAEGGEWDEFRMVRSLMRSTGLRKVIPEFLALQSYTVPVHSVMYMI
ncbi:hypothetical protein RJ639_002392 [Escallonia herrerae]|uniref:Pentatricopeptide repeat-containing protein n=1 Tax=Escallonia herrerae TaxID=1293975 RepID=A0AA89BSI6_9ASTE|nr:hypothetical protein RJ639_002392 [Escallonia herrerae]